MFLPPPPIKILCMVVLTLQALGTSAASSGSIPPDDLEVKAAFVLNFVRMVNWQEVQGEHDPSKLMICVSSNSDLFAAIRAAVKDKTAGNRSITAAVGRNPLATSCRVLVVEAGDYVRVVPLLQRLQNTPLLTIGNGPGFLEAGGMVELLIENRRVLFDVSLPAIRKSGLEVSARLLRLAKSFRKESKDGT